LSDSVLSVLAAGKVSGYRLENGLRHAQPG